MPCTLLSAALPQSEGNGQNYVNVGFQRTLGKFNNPCMVSLATGGLVSASVTTVPPPSPQGGLSKDLSLLYVMFTLRSHAAPKGKHMALYAVVCAHLERAAGGNSTRLCGEKNVGLWRYGMPGWIVLKWDWSCNLRNQKRVIRAAKISAIIKCSASRAAARRRRENVRCFSASSRGPRLCAVAKLSFFIYLCCQQENERLEKTPDNLYT